MLVYVNTIEHVLKENAHMHLGLFVIVAFALKTYHVWNAITDVEMIFFWWFYLTKVEYSLHLKFIFFCLEYYYKVVFTGCYKLEDESFFSYI